MDLTLQKTLFGFARTLTEKTPRGGARFLDAAVRPLLALPILSKNVHRRNQRILSGLDRLDRVLILSDIHLGDAVMMQSLATAVRDFFPLAEVHYAVSRNAAPFLEGHPDVTRLWPIYTGSPLPSDSDLQAVEDLLKNHPFDLVVNACPFFVPGRPLPHQGAVLDFMTHAPRIMRNEINPGEPNHFMFQAHLFLTHLLREKFTPVRQGDYRGGQLVLDDESMDRAASFLDGLHLEPHLKLVLVNPDTASPYTRPPVVFLQGLLRRLAVEENIHLLVGEGHTDKGVGIRLWDSMPEAYRHKVSLVPASLPGTAYAALIDRMDAFVSGDTGPLHWAAARKVSRTGQRPFRNRTAVYSLFGATPARMSGYDDHQPGFLSASQDAPSRTFISEAPCRNITCLNKLHITCRNIRCFEGLSHLPVAVTVIRNLDANHPTEKDPYALSA